MGEEERTDVAHWGLRRMNKVLQTRKNTDYLARLLRIYFQLDEIWASLLFTLKKMK